MEIKGTIIAAMPEVSGVSRSGNNWKKREYVLEYNEGGNYPRKVAFTCFGDNADRIQLKVGDKVNMFFDIESREFNGRWYTDIRCWRCDLDTEAAPAPAAPGAPAAPAPIPGAPAAPADDFPF